MTKGALRDKKGRLFKIPRLYDFVFWRYVLFLFMFGIVLLPTVFSWHGYDNTFIQNGVNDESSILRSVESEKNRSALEIAAPETHSAFLISFIAFIFIPWICMVWIPKKYNHSNSSRDFQMEIPIIITFAGLLLLLISPIHPRFAEGQVVSKSEGVNILNARFEGIYYSHMKKGEYEKAFKLATKMRDGEIDRIGWYLKEKNSAIATVIKQPLSLDKYVDTLKLTLHFFSLYLSYLQQLPPILANMQCKDDPWMMYSSNTPSSKKLQIDKICNERAEEMTKAIKRSLKE